MFTRRDLLKQSSAFTALTFLEPFSPVFSRMALADNSLYGNSDNHLFLLVKVFGGMDATLGLDPQVLPADADQNDAFLEYRPDEIIQVENLRLGPSAKPLVPHAKDCLAVNGVMMRRDAGHSVCLQYSVTGRGDGKAAVLPAELGLASGFGPFGLAMNENAYTAGKSVLLSLLSDLREESKAGILTELIEKKLKNFIPEGTPIEEAQKTIVAAKGTSEKLVKTLAEFAAANGGNLNDPLTLAAAFQSGACQHALFNIDALNLDTHSGHEGVHLTNQKKIWEQVADLFSLFKKLPYKEGSLFDYTTFMVTSEFSRTPALNAAKGKDHNAMTNSILLAGKNIRGGNTVGKSRLIPRKKSHTGIPEHYAWPFNFKEGKPAESPENASFFYPENVIRTVGKVFHDPLGFAPVPLSTPVIPGVAKSA